MRATAYSKETQTIIQLFEQLTAVKRKQLLEKIQQLTLEQESESKWEQLLETHPKPMIDMAKNALREHKSGRSKPMKL
jgi:hypothetical protein